MSSKFGGHSWGLSQGGYWLSVNFRIFNFNPIHPGPFWGSVTLGGGTESPLLLNFWTICPIKIKLSRYVLCLTINKMTSSKIWWRHHFLLMSARFVENRSNLWFHKISNINWQTKVFLIRFSFYEWKIIAALQIKRFLCRWARNIMKINSKVVAFSVFSKIGEKTDYCIKIGFFGL